MSRGRRYNREEKKLNFKKVFAVIIAIIVIIMFVVGIRKMLTQDKNSKISSESYFVCLENNKYGIINGKGNTIIEPAYAELIVIPNENKDVFLCTYDVNYEDGTYKTKALNSKNEEIFTKYEEIEALLNWDENKNVIYNKNVLKIKMNGKYGLLSIEGKEILPCEYDKIYELNGNKNSIVVQKEDKVGIVDEAGKKVVDTKYKEIKKLSKDYTNGYITVDENNKYGIVDCANNTILENKYSEILPVYSNGMYVVKGSEGYNVVGKDSNVITKKEYQNIKEIQGSKIIVQENNKYGVINSSGEQILPCDFEDINFSYTDMYIVKKNGAYGIVNSKNETALEIAYKSINYIEGADFIDATKDGIESEIIDNKLEVKLKGIISEINTEKGYLKIRINNEYKYYNFKFEEKNSTEIFPNNTMYLSKKEDKYGFIDKNGNVIVDYIYNDATEQNNFGYASVNKDGKWGSIDEKGNIVANTENNLTGNSIIDFIGTWHLMKDTNMNCYTK